MRLKHILWTGLVIWGLASNWAVGQELRGPEVQLDKAVHFVAPTGEDVVAQKGRYRVEPQGEGQLRLVPEGGQDALLIKAESAKHEETVTEPGALSGSAEEDVHHVVVLMPEGKSLDAVGSYSGIRSREVLSLAKPLSPGQVAAMRTPMPSLQAGEPGKNIEKFAQGPVPMNVKVTAVSPTTVRVEWAQPPNAIRYVISRNGAPDITVEGNQFSYLDSDRKPAMLHTYTVAAHYNPPLLPGRSAPIQVLTPPLLPPQNFKATMSGPAAVTLSWIGRSEATSYRIIRNGGNLPATILTSIGVTTYVDQNLSPGQYSYTIFSVIRLPSGEELFGEYSSPVTLKIRPFNIVAIGDSIMWGQGLRPENKFATKVKDWLQSWLGKPATLYLDALAHSGAVTHPSPEEAGKEQSILPGEVPSHNPSISYQAKVLAPAKVNPQEVDLVLVDGCINDLSVMTILNPVGHDPTLRAKTREYCTYLMLGLLTDVAITFPNAKVVVTGYFPIVSPASNIGTFGPIWDASFPPDNPGTVTHWTLYRERAAERSNIFFRESTASLQSVVDTLNSMPPPIGKARFVFANPGFASENAYAASNTWLWPLPAIDEAINGRFAGCQQYQQKDSTCYTASMGHPNVRGAQAYADAIKAVLPPFLPEWQNSHKSSTAPEDWFVIGVRPGPVEVDGSWFTVIAAGAVNPADPYSNLAVPLQGTVEINDRPAGALGTQVRYAFKEKNPTDILVRVDVPGRRMRSFTIPVRSLAINVNLTNNGDPRTSVITVTDAVSGERRTGTVIVNPNSPKQVVGPTGQPLTYASCGQITQAQTLTTVRFFRGPAPCGGTVHVPYYTDVYFNDIKGAIELLKIDRLEVSPAQITPKRMP